MSSPKTAAILIRLGQDVRGARLRRGMAVSDLAARSGVSPSTLARLEKGEAGVAIGTLADVLVVLGLSDRLADLFDVRHDDVGLALDETRVPRRGKTYGAALRRRRSKQALGANLHAAAAESMEEASLDRQGVDPDGVAF